MVDFGDAVKSVAVTEFFSAYPMFVFLRMIEGVLSQCGIFGIVSMGACPPFRAVFFGNVSTGARPPSRTVFFGNVSTGACPPFRTVHT
jgi:hypothetical protein